LILDLLWTMTLWNDFTSSLDLGILAFCWLNLKIIWPLFVLVSALEGLFDRFLFA